MVIDIDDLRCQKRCQSKFSILLNYICPESGIDDPERCACLTEDISESGLKIVSANALPLGVSFPIEIQVVELNEVFGFLGEVKWCLEVDDAPTFFIGIKLLKVIKNDYKKWLNLIEQLQ
ncbi:PilZ domain-containing protein [Aliikangiella sp. IMCC44359]|uniref:PilZ domain-containing protein n=1 Tax=Aliikangiella sp. IMCC44359 TaxID=3459125 RepID=UPI00403AD49A